MDYEFKWLNFPQPLELRNGTPDYDNRSKPFVFEWTPRGKCVHF